MIHVQERLMHLLQVGGRDAVLNSLQCALQLEFSTIPIYLYAFYSLDKTKNSVIGSILRSVVIEEMLHMTLVCNLINSLGGTPKLSDSAVIPRYPGPLPGGVESDLVVHLEAFSPAQLDVFIKIEEPEKPIDFPDAALIADAAPVTIGAFYREIKAQMSMLGDNAFQNPPRNQIGPDAVDDAIIVTDVQTASQAIDLIVEQGEGTDTDPGEVVGSDFAHYYRFMEIAKGHKLVPNPNAGPDAPPAERFHYAGSAITLDPSGVYPAPRDPKAADYSLGSAERAMIDDFNLQYKKMLDFLQNGFSGSQDQIGKAVDIMITMLRTAAHKLMTTPGSSDHSLGPTFEV